MSRTWTGVAVGIAEVPPLPSCPALFSPEHQIVWSAFRYQLCRSPVATSVTHWAQVPLEQNPLSRHGVLASLAAQHAWPTAPHVVVSPPSGVLPSGTHVPPRLSPALLSNREPLGHSVSGKLQKPWASQVPFTDSSTHYVDDEQVYEPWLPQPSATTTSPRRASLPIEISYHPEGESARWGGVAASTTSSQGELAARTTPREATRDESRHGQRTVPGVQGVASIPRCLVGE